MANKKLSQQELESIKEIQQRGQAYQNELGRLEGLKLDIKKRKQEIIQYNEETVKLEQQLVDQLEEKYGKGSINLENGEFVETQSSEESNTTK